MNELDAIEEAGRWYADVLDVVNEALGTIIHTRPILSASEAAPLFVQVLARRGYMIEKAAE